MIFTRLANTKRTSSALAMALSLAVGGALAATAVEAPAFAQKNKEKQQKRDNSKGFVEAFQPILKQYSEEGADPAAIAAQVPTLLAAVETEDDRFIAGNLIAQIAQRTQDRAMLLQGYELMLESGKAEPENIAPYTYRAGELAFDLKQYGKARTLIQRAIDLGYAEGSPHIYIAEAHFAEGQYKQGFAFLDDMIAKRRAAGEAIDESWVKRGLAIAYNNKMKDEAHRYAQMYAAEFPSETSWGDAIAILLNTGTYEYPEILDILRLARRAEALRTAQMYLEFIEAADPRKLPGEVQAVINEGIANGKLDASDPFVKDSLSQAATRVSADERDLPSLIRDARASGASVRTVVAAADAVLSYGRGAEAEELYGKALNMPGANTPVILTRMGIAQLDQGRYAEAQATFQRVEGARQAIAGLWRTWTDQQAGS